jgi:hypothetical protein
MWPTAFIGAGTGWLLIPDPGGSLLAATGFAAAGGLCLGNALHCRRTHCVVTGPLYLVCAALFLARVSGLPVAAGSIVMVAVAGTVIAFIPEWSGARYLGDVPRRDDSRRT